MPSRRAVLVGSVAVLTPGCTSVFDGCRYKWVVEAESYDPVEDVPADLDGADAEFARQTIREGAVTVETVRGKPLRDGTYVEHRGSYYRIDVASEAREEIPALKADVEWENGRGPTDDDPVIAYEDLPENDRAALDYSVHGGAYGTDSFPSSGLSFRDHRLAYPDGREDSRLASLDHVWIDWDGRMFEITVHGAGRTSQYTYRYEATRVATDVDEFRELMARDRIVTFDDLREGEREIMDQAVRDQYEECGEREDERSGALVQFHERVEREVGREFGSLPVAYEGEWYVLRVDSIVNEF